jgi:hypothetical protein
MGQLSPQAEGGAALAERPASSASRRQEKLLYLCFYLLLNLAEDGSIERKMKKRNIVVREPGGAGIRKTKRPAANAGYDVSTSLFFSMVLSLAERVYIEKKRRKVLWSGTRVAASHVGKCSL